jgi:hypothetical protein
MRSCHAIILAVSALAATLSCSSGTTLPSPPHSTPPPQTNVPAGPARPLEGVTVTITDTGFVLDAATVAMFSIDALRVYKGARITFVNKDSIPHDIQSDPPFIHSECPEVAAAGFVVPGQAKSTEPLDRLISCGFHDHFHEGDPRYAGRASVEAR